MAAGNGEQHRRPHLLLVPGSWAGHFYGSHQILHLLSAPQYASKIIVTVANIDSVLAQLVDLKEKGAFGSLDLRFEELIFDPLPDDLLEIMRVKPGPEFPMQIAERGFEPFKKKLLLAKGRADAITCILSDMFFFFLADLAEELKVPWYPLVPSPVQYTYGCYLRSNPLLLSTDPEVRKQKLPGLEFSRVFDYPADILDYPEFFARKCEQFKRSRAILINDVEEWDAPVCAVAGLQDHLKSSKMQTPRVIFFGPVANIDGFRLCSPAPKFEDSQKPECLTWLEKQRPSSVLYIAFGTMLNITPKDVLELAHALEESGVSFLWVLKVNPAETLESVLPEGFVDRIQGRGFIQTSFAPQTAILQHPSVRGFMSHCGWNSCLESVCAGVTLITWPLSLDQMLNARFLVNVWNAGIGIKKPDEDYRNLVTKEEILKAIQLLMIGKGGHEVRKNVQQLKSLAETAIQEGGSSYKAIHSFVTEIINSP